MRAFPPQTKLVVIEETYRELRPNSRFARYASSAGFAIRACEGYDPESKGKVDAGVKYVKDNGLYGEAFSDFAHLQAHLCAWLDTLANARVHATTGQIPSEHYGREERCAMAAYLTPAGIAAAPALDTRKADKTGLITYQANKESAKNRGVCRGSVSNPPLGALRTGWSCPGKRGALAPEAEELASGRIGLDTSNVRGTIHRPCQ